MAIIRSFGAMQRIAAPTPSYSTLVGSPMTGSHAYTYAAIYRTQPQVRTVVEFFSRNIAQLGLPLYERLGDDDRKKRSDHPLAKILRKPSPKMTRYRLIESTLNDLGVFMNGFWGKVRPSPKSEPIGVFWIPAREMQVEGRHFPELFRWKPDGASDHVDLEPSEVVHFSGYNPESTLTGLSAIETLRQILAEDRAAAIYRQSFWKNAARPGMMIQRPKESGTWNKEQVKEWRRQMGEFESGPNAGRTLLLQEGMTAAVTSHSAKDSELTASRKLTREEVAAAYHVPLPMVGILDHATFSNIKEQHKHLYADCLGPWLVMIEEEIERQLLPDFDNSDDLYVEFNIQEKLKGSFEEQTDSISKATGGKPIMTQNEGRARLNLPRSSDASADSLEPPANLMGNRADDTEIEADPEQAKAAVRAHLRRQAARLAKMPEDERAEFFGRTLSRWDGELSKDLSRVYGSEASRMASVINGETLALLNAGTPAFDREVVLPC